MSRKFLFVLFAMVALAACDRTTSIDQDKVDQENRQVWRQLSLN